ncbi:hotdog fold thioesterase [Olivibacter sp. SDN3]|uniref:hotdog fold thioesterase n=1 Tax=Olivibacter sp. SDN3 TaxID=2764720 RepID=UPI0016515031|nr:hotdog fold thioesterase [Olivibacter sp. SDN3]QNL51241.1 hotdog fold thioesterase [Olivibacter sp. SDN3]
MIWNSVYTIDELNDRPANHIGALLDIKFTEITENSLTATMPVDDRTRQPAGILHGGASVVLAETVGSVASNLVVDGRKYMGVGLEVNANHLRPVKEGLVKAVCTPLHIGAKTHIWDVKLYNEKDKLTCVSRLTVAIVPKS